MGFTYRRNIYLSRDTWLNISTRGISISHRRGRVTVNSRGRIWVRIARGLGWRGRL